MNLYEDARGLQVDQATDMGDMIGLHLGDRARALDYPKLEHVIATFTVLDLPVADVGAAVRGLAFLAVLHERVRRLSYHGKWRFDSPVTETAR